MKEEEKDEEEVRARRPSEPENEEDIVNPTKPDSMYSFFKNVFQKYEN